MKKYYRHRQTVFKFQIVFFLLALTGYPIAYCQSNQLIEGPVVRTPELDNAECNANDPACHCIDDGIWCWKETIVTVTTPDDSWAFVGKPWLEVVGPTAGSAEWNKLHLKENIPTDRFEIIEDLPNRKKARVLSSSNSIAIKLVCWAAKKNVQPAQSSDPLKCVAGDCVNGYGRLMGTDLMVVGKFSGDYPDGASLQYWKNGNVKMAYYVGGQEQITLWMSGENSTVFIGYQTLNPAGQMQFHNGLMIEPSISSVSKLINGVKYPYRFDLKKEDCIVGNCKDGFSAAFVPKQWETSKGFLYIGNFQAGGANGIGLIYNFGTSFFRLGKFQELGLAEGADFLLIDNDVVTSFVAGGKEIYSLTVFEDEIWPAPVQTEPPSFPTEMTAEESFKAAQAKAANNQNSINNTSTNVTQRSSTNVSSAPRKKKRGFLSGLIDVLLGAVVIGAEIAVQSYEADQKANREREAREQRERQNQPRQQQVLVQSQTPPPTNQQPQTAKCNYAFDLSLRQNGRSRVSGPEIVDVTVEISNVYSTTAAAGKSSLGPFTTRYVDKDEEEANEMREDFLDEYSEVRIKNNTKYIYTVTKTQKSNTCR